MPLNDERLYEGWDASVCARCKGCDEYFWFVDETAEAYAELVINEVEEEVRSFHTDEEEVSEALTEIFLEVVSDISFGIMSTLDAVYTISEIDSTTRGLNRQGLVKAWEDFKDWVFRCPIYINS